ncbi:MAG: orotidine-5'-phosphate decarboxylase [Rikenellaceae bacterium]|jgi:orotidine-5'-phosphate decarboxylase|nr:orotidine-5'-phosphate decarboxylase [Rikenellaceae bacterium]
MTAAQLYENILAKRSFLCVGLDTDIRKTPACLAGAEDPQFEFNKAIIDATAEYAVAFKPNLAFYEEHGAAGWTSFERTCRYIREKHPDILIIADAKRGDIGNTAEMYARAFFANGSADAVTVSPYMGSDSVKPFLAQQGFWTVILALTSNPGAADFEIQKLHNGKLLYEQVLEITRHWGTVDNAMYVVGATQASMLESVRRIVPNHFLLVPGVGAQGGSLEEVARHGMNKQCGLLVNSSRAIIYADSSENFAATAAQKAAELRGQMSEMLIRYLCR